MNDVIYESGTWNTDGAATIYYDDRTKDYGIEMFVGATATRFYSWLPDGTDEDAHERLKHMKSVIASYSETNEDITIIDFLKAHNWFVVEREGYIYIVPRTREVSE